MPLESVQMLITARVDRGELALEYIAELASTIDARPHYTPRMRNHICAKWVTHCDVGFKYLETLMLTLGDLFEDRYGKEHKSVKLYKMLPDRPKRHRRKGKPVPLAVKDFERYQNDPIRTYREYYKKDKERFATWSFSEPPPWW